MASVFRLVLGLLFLIPGSMKLAGLISGGHPLTAMIGVTLTWILAIVEVIGGMSLLLGWLTNITIWPLMLVMVGAIVLVTIPAMATNPNPSGLLFHILAIVALYQLYVTGPGKIRI